ncbi:XdhC family protein [Arthrobacter rhizosphaerae]|uniref:XdhC family protein n=1 Tax=Arthrobacter rhizosphaerae TaxID=2855490 RepID=UPI001FF21032|nr:XdhC/CoxI family protein [Arthrobacter rhizosphaerae]
MLNLLPSVRDWQPAVSGQPCAVATVVGATGSVPRPVGTSMIVSAAGEVLGSLSGGCVEGAVVEAALQTLHDGGTRRESFGYSADDAFAAGLTCGGRLDVHIEQFEFGPSGPLWMKLQEPRLPDRTALALIRRLDREGKDAVVIHDPAHFSVTASAEISALLDISSSQHSALRAAAAHLEPLVRGGRSGLVRLAPQEGCLSGAGQTLPASGQNQPNTGQTVPEPVTLLVESRLPPARMLIFGANDFSAALLPAARLLDYRVTVCDARQVFAHQKRFTEADEVITDWPHRYLAAEVEAGRIDSRTAVCILTHDPKFDVPLLATALQLELAYVGAMGSRQSHHGRVESLLAEGVTSESLSRLHSPIGLDLGAVTPAEVAVSIMAELVATLNRGNQATPASLKDGVSLKDGAGPIHWRPASTKDSTEEHHREGAWT